MPWKTLSITRNDDSKRYIYLGRPARGFAQLHNLRKQGHFVFVYKVDSVSACIIIRLFIVFILSVPQDMKSAAKHCTGPQICFRVSKC